LSQEDSCRTVGSKCSCHHRNGNKKKDKKEQPIVSMNKDEGEYVWDDVYVKDI
jgi:hypothetical protein